MTKIANGIAAGILVGVLSVGCAMPRSDLSRRLGLIDRMKGWEPTYRSGRALKSGSVAREGLRVAQSTENSRAIVNGGGGVAAYLTWPLRKIEVTSPFGRRGRDQHEGVDLRAEKGTPVYAAQAGTVLYANSKISGYGKLIVIRHPNRLATLYAHNSRLLVSAGQQVRQGQQISLSGSTGHTHGPHLHFEIRQGLAAVDPMKFLWNR